MPRFLEEQLKSEYGQDSAVPYKIMNSLGYMRGNQETAKGRAAEAKHAAKVSGRRRRPAKSVLAAHKFLRGA
jgi:hypothetical protein